MSAVLVLLFCSFAAKAQTEPDSLKNNVFGSYVFMPIEFPIIDNEGFEDPQFQSAPGPGIRLSQAVSLFG